MVVVAMMSLLFLKPLLLTLKEINKGKEKKYKREEKKRNRETGGAFCGIALLLFSFTFPQHLAFPHSKVLNLVWVQLPRA
jgi:hypothetical protein